jgi:hypothetical protein
MAAVPRNIPRFLPTLTEVVLPPVQAPRASGNEVRAVAGVEELAIAQSVRSQVEAEMEALFRDAVSTALLEQVDGIAARVRAEIEPVLRQAVADMVAHEIAARRHG